jgi:hypothetical protein
MMDYDPKRGYGPGRGKHALVGFVKTQSLKMTPQTSLDYRFNGSKRKSRLCRSFLSFPLFSASIS